MTDNGFWADRRTRTGYETAGKLAKMYNRQNYRMHPEQQQQAVEGSLNDLGNFDAVKVSEVVGKLFDGHLRVELALLRFGEDYKLPVDYYDLNEAETKQALMYRDLTAQMAEIDIPQLQELRFELTDFDNEAFDEFLAAEFDFDFGDGGGNGAGTDTPPQIDRAAELQEIWQVQPGDLWACGEHRIICGDCTDKAVVERVMGNNVISCIVTDPPYGVNYSGGSTQREQLYGDKSPSLYFPSLKLWKIFCNHNVALYLWYADGDQAVSQAVSQAGWKIRRNLIWNKNQAQFGALSQQYKQKHEPFLYCHLNGKSPFWAGDTTEVTVWDISRNQINEFHPTEKPPELFERAIKNSSKPNDIIFDGFLGSGTTLIACHNLNRRCRGIELHPPYVSVCLQRFQDHTGITPQRVSE